MGLVAVPVPHPRHLLLGAATRLERVGESARVVQLVRKRLPPGLGGDWRAPPLGEVLMDPALVSGEEAKLARDSIAQHPWPFSNESGRVHEHHARIHRGGEVLGARGEVAERRAETLLEEVDIVRKEHIGVGIQYLLCAELALLQLGE
eukprot:CAMPEP_0183356812 /NCGR_PEP_ID=MMETSP0164_2-20130417/45208_1 /TAXON_ID=221442 /ORGANISM="Coccolithus pelagicus ssp braarudi, Strain PLY182g" /LENGTH=147 /DNA_ID=CAMNT_0025530313 /DNA_START=475 /DNA_END=918 /DNA_ORIENTATION=+